MFSTPRLKGRHSLVSSVKLIRDALYLTPESLSWVNNLSGRKYTGRPASPSFRYLSSLSASQTSVINQKCCGPHGVHRQANGKCVLPHPDSLHPQTASFSSSPIRSKRHIRAVMRDTINAITLKWGDRGIFQKFVQPLEVDDSQSLLKMRYVYLTTCVGFWEDIPVGLRFDAAYADSHPDAPYSINTPVVVGLHGAFGSHQDLLPLLEPLAAQGYRVIVPTFPGYGDTRGRGPGHEDCFTHSPEEKAVFLADLLTVIGIPRVDLLVGHGAGCYPLLQLCADQAGVQSSMLICPAVHMPYRGTQPLAVLKAFVQWWEVPMLRPALKALTYLTTLNKGSKNTTALQIATGIQTVVNVDYNHVINSIVHMDQKKFPCCVIFSDNDRHLELSLMNQFVELLGVPEDRIETRSSDPPNTSTVSDVTDYPKAVMLEGGTHYPMTKYCNVILSEMRQLLQAIGKGR